MSYSKAMLFAVALACSYPAQAILPDYIMCAAQQHADNIKEQELKSSQPRTKQKEAEESAVNKNEQNKNTTPQESLRCKKEKRKDFIMRKINEYRKA